MQIKIAKNTLLAAILIAIMSVFIMPNEAKARPSTRDYNVAVTKEKCSCCIEGVVRIETWSYNRQVVYREITDCDGKITTTGKRPLTNEGHLTIDLMWESATAIKNVNPDFSLAISVIESGHLIPSTIAIDTTVTISLDDDGNAIMEHVNNFYVFDFSTLLYDLPIVLVSTNCSDGTVETVVYDELNNALLSYLTSAPPTSEWQPRNFFMPYNIDAGYGPGIGYVQVPCYQITSGCETIKLYRADGLPNYYSSRWDWLHEVQAVTGGGGLLSPNPCASALDTILLGEKATVYPVPADRSEGITVAINSALVPYIQSGTISVVDYATNEVLHTFTLTNLAEMHIAGNYFSAAAGMQSLKISLQLNDPCKGIITNNSYLTFILQ